MAKWVHSNVLDNGLNAIKTNCTHMLLIKAYNIGDSYATVMSNMVADVTMVSGDYTLSSSASNRVLTTASGKSVNATNGSGISPDLHFAFTDGSSTVYWVTDETSNQVVTAGNPVNFPQLTYTANQPT